MTSASAERSPALTALVNRSALLRALDARGHVVDFKAAAHCQLDQPLEFDESDPTAKHDGTAPAFVIKQYAAPIDSPQATSYTGCDPLSVPTETGDGTEALINLLANHLLTSDGKDLDGKDLDGKDLDGLPALCPLIPDRGTYGGIDRALHQEWRSQVRMPGLDRNLVPELFVLIKALTRGKVGPDLILAGTRLHERLTEAFPKGSVLNARIEHEPDLPTDLAYVLTTRFLYFKSLATRGLEVLDPSRPVLVWAGNLTCSRASQQGVFVYR